MSARSKSVSFYILGILVGMISGVFEGWLLLILALLATFFVYYSGFIMGKHHTKKK